MAQHVPFQHRCDGTAPRGLKGKPRNYNYLDTDRKKWGETPWVRAEALAPGFASSFVMCRLYRIRLAEFMERNPIIICAPFCVTAFEDGALEVDIDGKEYPLFEANGPALWGNCAGLPGVVVSGGHNTDNLPIGNSGRRARV
jgi:hypothetical protein